MTDCFSQSLQIKMSVVFFKGHTEICCKEASGAQYIFKAQLHFSLQNLSFDYLLKSINDIKF